MKKKTVFSLILVLLSVFLLTGCGKKPVFGVSSNEDNSISILAEKAPKDSLGIGYLNVGETGQVSIDPAFSSSGEICIRFFAGLLGSEDFPDQPALELTVRGTDPVSLELAPGEYTVAVIALGRINGTALIRAEMPAAVPPVGEFAEESSDAGETYSGIDIDNLALRPDGEAGILYENDGLRLLVPLEYDGLLLTETPQDDDYGILFSVSEKASIEAARAAGWNGEGAGWLFSIGRIDEARLRQLLCYTDLSGVEIFAKDETERYFVLYTPTDVRYIREDNEAMVRDQDQWFMLLSWVGHSVRDSFLSENRGLSAETRGSTELELHLARVEYLPEISYTVSTTQFGPLAPASEDFDALPYLEKLTHGVRYERVENEEAPDGEYVVLSFPDEDLRFDFFLADSGKNYIREVANERYELLFRAVFEDGSISASAVMQDWYNALASSLNLT